MPTSQLSLQLLGAPRIDCDDVPLKIETRKASALLFYLAVTGETHTRDTLATMFWPESDQAHARGALRRTLAALRKTPLRDYLEADRETLTFREDQGCASDVEVFQNRLAECTKHGHTEGEVCSACLTPLIEAVNLYRGDFMTGFSLGNCPLFDDWQFFLAEDLRREMTGALERLVHYLNAQKQIESAIAYARRWLSFDPLHEPAHRQLMQLYAGTGQRSAALQQYQECVRILEEELGVLPLEETTQLFQFLQESPAGPVEVRPQAVIGEPIHAAQLPLDEELQVPEQALEPSVFPPGVGLQNFPLPTTPFMGREEELESVLEMLRDPTCRLLTLLGPGGIGKTRLSLQAARGVNGAFQDGIFFIPLSSLSSFTSLVYSIADALQISFYSNLDPRDELLGYLRERKMLLLMDNFEHLTEAADFVNEVLKIAPVIKFLVTSRERLNLQAEWVFELKGLKVPEDDEPEKAEDYSAVQLFIQTAKRVGGVNAIKEKDRPFAIRICQLLGGTPLGIELAAAWVRVLSCEEILQEIEHNLDFLIASSRDVPERHQSLRAVFEHSWKLLPLEEQRIFRRMSVFRGGFQKEAAQRVAGASLAVLSSLADKSLLYHSQDGRYDILLVLRQYAEEKLDEVPEEQEQTQGRHSQYYAEFLHLRSDHLRRGKQEEAAKIIGEEIENIRWGWRWAIERLNQSEIDKYLDPQFFFYEIRGWYKEGEEIFDLAVERLKFDQEAGNGTSADLQKTLAKALARQGRFAYRLGKNLNARKLLEQSLALSRQLDEKGEIAFCLIHLGEISRLQGEYDKARKLLEESIHLCRQTGELRKLGGACNNLAIVVASEGEYSKAEELFQESQTIYKKVGDLWGTSKVIENLGSVANLQGDYSKATRLYKESLVIHRRINDRGGIGSCLTNMGVIAYETGEYEQAIRLHQESLEIFREIGISWSIGLCLNDLGKAALALGDLQKADEYFHASFKASVEIGGVPICLAVLVGMANLLIVKGNPQKALEHLLITLNHPSCEQETRDKAERLLTELEKEIPVSVIKTARERMKNRYLKKLILIAEEILKKEEERATALNENTM